MNVRLPLLFTRGVLLASVLAGTAKLCAQRMELADATATAVIVETATIHTEVTGRLAVTTFDLVFRNPNPRVLEGTFCFPLLEGQNVVRFALDINGALREAVPVEKTHGRVVFEEIERRGVDPGLLEQTAGNNYRARVYPIPAHGTRRIVLAYQEDVVRGSATPAYRLKLDFPERVKHLALNVTVHTGGSSPARATSTLPFELPPWREGQFLDIAQNDVDARGLLELELPRLDRPRVLTEKRGDEEYFYAEAPLHLPAQPRPAPRVVGVLWDSSGSGGERDHTRELALLDAWFKRVPAVEVRLWRMRDRAEAAGTFHVRSGDWSALRTELARTAYDGATSLDGLLDVRDVDEWLLFTDGLVNYGVTPTTKKLPFRRPLHVVLAAPRADPAWLRGLAAKYGGEFVNLLELTPAAGAERLRTQSPRVLGVDYAASDALDVFPEPGTPVTNGPLVVTGILRAKETTLQLRVGTSERDARTIAVNVVSGANPSHVAARGWALTKIDLLSRDAAANRADIRRTSRDFGIATADTSLLVLETIADYVRYDVKPPEELRREWNAQRKAIAADRRKNNDAHLEAVVAAFEQRIAWWEKSFPKDAAPEKRVIESKRAQAMPGQARALAGAPMPAPSASLPLGADSEVVVLSPFQVSTDREVGYVASATFSARSGSVARARDTSIALSESSAEAIAPTITLQRWTPDAGYLERLQRAEPRRAYAVYLEERTRHARQPGFFLDVANWFFECGEPALGLRILSNLAEIELEDAALLRTLAHRLVQVEHAELAVPLFERILALRPDEPQSRRDLALACADTKQFQRAVDLLWEVVSQAWDHRFPQIEQIALTELNALVATCDEDIDVSRIDPRLLKNLPLETRVVLTWDANDCDIDLWVTDPNGERASYQNQLTYQGGRMSDDYTGGYGPEEFLLRKAKPGAYRVQIEYFGDRRQTALGPVTAQVRLISSFGTRQQTEKRTTVRLEDRKQQLEIGTFEFGGGRVARK